MSLDIPINIDTVKRSIDVIPTKTPYINFDTGKIIGYVDNKDAVAQAIKLALLTPRFRLIIYNSQYGSDAENLIDKNYSDSIFRSEAKRCVLDSLLCDDRIIAVYDFDFEDCKDGKIIRFSVDTIFGTLHDQEVKIYV